MEELLQVHKSCHVKQSKIHILGTTSIQKEIENKFRQGNPENQHGRDGK